VSVERKGFWKGVDRSSFVYGAMAMALFQWALEMVGVIWRM
jgi:hypothetical protein